MSTIAPARLLSPTGRRLFAIDYDDEKNVSTAATLTNIFGWKRYAGPAQADKRGWVIPGTDPAVIPKPYKPRV